MNVETKLPTTIIAFTTFVSTIVYGFLYIFAMLLHLRCMDKRKQATIRALFVNGYTDSLRRVRKSQKGLKQPYIKPVVIIGEYPEGITCIDAAEVCKTSRSAMYQLLFRAIKGGFIYKSNKRYYLTDSGKCVYNSICKEFDRSMNEILNVLMDEVRRRM